MHRIIRTKQSGQVLGSVLCLLGFFALLVVLWKAWPSISNSTDFSSALWSQILNDQINLGSVMSLKLIYVTIGGTAFLILGVVVLALSRQIFYVSSGSTTLQCPYCKNQWKARRAVGWAECPFCRKFGNPQIVRKT